MHNPYVAILLAALAAWIFGSVWYGVLANAWMAALGNDPAQIEAKRKVQKVPYVAMAVSFACELVMAWVLAGILPLGEMTWIMGAAAGLMIGIGLMVTPVLVNNMFAGRTLKLAMIDGLHWIGVAVIQGAVLGALLGGSR
jgi:hypothetical protein